MRGCRLAGEDSRTSKELSRLPHLPSVWNFRRWPEGLPLKLEGGLGRKRGEYVGIFSLVRIPPDSVTSKFDYSQGIPRGPFSFSCRAKGSWDADLGNGNRMRLGGIFCELTGEPTETTPVHCIIMAGPSRDGPWRKPGLRHL